MNKEEKRKRILEISNLKGPTIELVDEVNQLKLEIIQDLLEKEGMINNVKAGKKDRRKHKIGKCYYNAARMTEENYYYVEGIITHKKNGYQICHAWNEDMNGEWWDFTLDDPEDFDYKGIKIPNMPIYETGARNGRIWPILLLFIDSIEELY